MIFTISTNQTKANRPALPQAVEITYLNISGTAKAGDTFNLVVRYKARDTGKIEMTFNFPDDVAPLNRTTGETYRTDTVQVNIIDSVYERTYQLTSYGVGKSNLEIVAKHISPAAFTHPLAMKRLGVIHDDMSYSAIDPKDAPADTMYVFHETEKTEKVNRKLQTTQRNVSISGRIFYPFELENGAITKRGVYGVRVRAYFYKYAYPNIPIHRLIVPSNLYEAPEAICDEQGNYSISFSTEDNLNDVYAIGLFVSVANDAVKLQSSMDINKAYLMEGAGNGLGWRALKHNFINYNGTTNFSATQDIEISINEGTTLRYAQMSREYLMGRINVDLPKINVVLGADELGAAGYFTPRGSDTIFINEVYANKIFTIAHEYAHYHYYKFVQNFSADNALLEGWATFSTFVIANYVEKIYGDKFDRYEDNCEIGPFQNKKYENIFYSNALYNTVIPSDITYMDRLRLEALKEMSKSICAFACYLWNLYDSYNDTLQGTPVIGLYDVGDNDDVSNQADRVFQIMHKLSTHTVQDYNSAFIGGIASNIPELYVPPLPDTLGHSVDMFYESLFSNSLSIIPSITSAQIKQGSLNATRLNLNDVRLNWLTQHYLQTIDPHRNLPRIYIWATTKYDEAKHEYYDWQYLTNLQFNAITAVVSANLYDQFGVNEQVLAYKVGTLNSNVIDPIKQWSYGAQIILRPPLNSTKESDTIKKVD